MAIDYALRIVAGGNASIQGALAQILIGWKEPQLVAGPPKQFAAMCGTSKEKLTKRNAH